MISPVPLAIPVRFELLKYLIVTVPLSSTILQFKLPRHAGLNVCHIFFVASLIQVTIGMAFCIVIARSPPCRWRDSCSVRCYWCGHWSIRYVRTLCLNITTRHISWNDRTYSCILFSHIHRTVVKLVSELLFRAKNGEYCGMGHWNVNEGLPMRIRVWVIALPQL